VVKVLFSILLIFSTVAANELTDKVRNMIGNHTYLVQKKLINILFKDQNSYYKNGKLDIVKITAKLKQNGLLNFYFKEPMEMQITFRTRGNPLLFLKIINESLHDIGYGFFITKRAKKVNEDFEWVISLKSESAIDPEIFAKELEKRAVYINDIYKKSLTEWEYDLDIYNAQIISKKVVTGEKIRLTKPMDDYWLDISNSSSIDIKSNIHDIWHPYVVFYDSYLHMIGYVIKKEKSKEERLEIPQNTKYIKISDFYSLSNIKRGLTIRLYP